MDAYKIPIMHRDLTSCAPDFGSGCQRLTPTASTDEKTRNGWCTLRVAANEIGTYETPVHSCSSQIFEVGLWCNTACRNVRPACNG